MADSKPNAVLSNEDRGWLLIALDTQISVFQRKARAEKNPQISGLVEADIAKLQALRASLLFSEQK